MIVCGDELYEDDAVDTLLNPQVIIEVLSDSTESYDRSKQYRHCQQVTSPRESVLVAQKEPAIDHFVRRREMFTTYPAVEGIDGEFAFASVPVRIPIADVYAGVAFRAVLTGPS